MKCHAAGLAGATLLAMAVAGCAAAGAKPAPAPAIHIDENPYPSTYVRYPGVPTVIQGATLYDGEGGRIENASLLIEDGLVKAVGGAELAIPVGASVVDGRGKWITPGVIDVHSHLGDYPSPGVSGNSDGNEATGAARPEVWAEHSVWPQDPGFSRALANGGVTALQILPGSANLFGGRSVVLKNVPARTMQGMKFPDAPYGLKMACGENPKRVYGNKGGPATRMGNIAVTRATWRWKRFAGCLPARSESTTIATAPTKWRS